MSDIDRTREILAQIDRHRRLVQQCRSAEAVFNLTSREYREASLVKRMLHLGKRNDSHPVVFSAEDTVAIHHALLTVRDEAQEAIHRLTQRVPGPTS